MRCRIEITSSAEGIAAYTPDQRFAPNAFKLIGHCRAAGDGARPQQRLVFPGPCVVLLVALEGIGAGDEQPRRPSGRRRVSTS